MQLLGWGKACCSYGDTAKAKRFHVLSLDANGLENFSSIAGGAFFTKLCVGELLLVPHCYCMLQLTKAEASAGVRFCIPPRTGGDPKLIAALMELLLQSFPELATNTHFKCIQAMKVPLNFVVADSA